MAVTLFPALDVSDGRLVGPDRGVIDGSDPVEVALRWQEEGATWIHLVDLDAAFDLGSNLDLLAGVIRRVAIRVQLSAGVGDEDSLRRALATGCDRVVVASTALLDTAWCRGVAQRYGERVVFGLDVRRASSHHGSSLALSPRGGSSTSSDVDAIRAAGALASTAPVRFIVTDVERDGSLTGPAIDLGVEVAEAIGCAVVVSGGVSTLDDLAAIATAASGCDRIDGVIVGSALHDGRFTVGQALHVLAEPRGAARGRGPTLGR